MKKIMTTDTLVIVFMLFIGALIGARILYTGEMMFLFLVWNIFLAWIPFVISGYFMEYRLKAGWKQVILFCSWLIFFPNALYIITDFVHLPSDGNVPVYYDIIVLFAASFVGLMMALISLFRAENLLRSYFSAKIIYILVPLIIFLGSFGVYLGRFQRWNSWNVLNDPLALASDILANCIHPVEHAKTWAVTLLLTTFFSIIYFLLRNISFQGINMKEPGEK